MTDGIVPTPLKVSHIMPIPKIRNLDSSDASNLRPVSNLSAVGKLPENAVARRLIAHLEENDLAQRGQSAYKCFHSTETALLLVLSDLINAIESGNLTLLALLDMSAAFDTVDHDI